MADVTLQDCTRDQIFQMNKLLDVFGEPATSGDAASYLVVIDAARAYYLKHMQRLRVEERNAQI